MKTAMNDARIKTTVEGELRARAIKNFARLHDAPYRPGAVGLRPYCSEGWPGDWEGRALLALSLLSKQLGVQSAFADGIVSWIKSICNAQGYRGEIIDWENINEQFFPSHSWLMRGLLEYAPDDAEIRGWVGKILDNLYLPMAKYLENYPQREGERPPLRQGGAQGALDNRFRGWLLSSDIGCLFISLDGISEACERLGREDLLPLLRRMADIFIRVDHTGKDGAPLQTHACLSGMRGILRVYRLTGDKRYLEAARQFFADYMRYGMSEYYANFDWFRTPSWSEPCGVIDSYMLAMELWDITRERRYLDIATLIWYNGVLMGQRPNGGFGCDSCAEDGWVRTTDFYEAFWCCTMRGGVGLGIPQRYAMSWDGEDLLIPLHMDALFEIEGGLRIRERTRMPREGAVEFEVLSGQKEARLRVFIPECAKNLRVEMDGSALAFSHEDGFASFQCALRAGSRIRVLWDFCFHMEPTVGDLHAGAGLYTLRHGVLILGARKGTMAPLDPERLRMQDGAYFYGQEELEPLFDRYLKSDERLKAEAHQILFRKAPEGK